MYKGEVHTSVQLVLCLIPRADWCKLNFYNTGHLYQKKYAVTDAVQEAEMLKMDGLMSVLVVLIICYVIVDNDSVRIVNSHLQQ